jgi:hypothetical protein
MAKFKKFVHENAVRGDLAFYVRGNDELIAAAEAAYDQKKYWELTALSHVVINTDTNELVKSRFLIEDLLDELIDPTAFNSRSKVLEG